MLTLAGQQEPAVPLDDSGFRQLFAFYCAFGDVENSTLLNSAKFSKFTAKFGVYIKLQTTK